MEATSYEHMIYILIKVQYVNFRYHFLQMLFSDVSGLILSRYTGILHFSAIA